MRSIAIAFGLIGCASPTPSRVSGPSAGVPAVAEPTPSAEVVDASPTPQIAEPEPAASVAEPAHPPDELPAREPRIAAKRPRERTLLVAELQALERLFGATPKSSPDRAVLMHRLAEGYVELEYSAGREPGGQKIVLAARKNALKYYLGVRGEYPTYAKLDEVLYYAGYEHERAGDLARARALYRELISKFSGSAFRLRIPAKVLGP